MSEAKSAADFDRTRRFVRVINTLPNGLIEFEFAIGSVEVAVELIMPQAAFDEFCAANHVEPMSAAPGGAGATEAEADFHWNLHQATHQRFR